jgi:NADH-quinone oxidoreductase subunit M
MDTFDDWALTLAVFTPLVGAIVMMLVPRDREDAHKVIALLTTLASLGFGVYLLVQFDYGEPRGVLQFAVD